MQNSRLFKQVYNNTNMNFHYFEFYQKIIGIHVYFSPGIPRDLKYSRFKEFKADEKSTDCVRL